MAFYDPDGKKLNSINEFVEIYSDAYFIGQDKVKNFNYVQSS